MDDSFAVDAHLAEFLISIVGENAPNWPRPALLMRMSTTRTGALGGGENLLRRGGIVEVGDDDTRFDFFGGEFGGEGLKAVKTARSEDEFCAAACQLTRESGADSGAGSGD